MTYYEKPADMCAMTVYDRDPKLGIAEVIVSVVKEVLSPENLEKDPVLRSKIDEEGYVSVNLIADLHRIRIFTDSSKVIVEALQNANDLEVHKGVKVRLALLREQDGE
ncbi:la-related protein 1B-like [Tropilaelaps mercedesae]|uniref:La-related protein 1B-like n=1 Tax=Tropilaelaps mercedesae TaxID=418985 RepID=A0A1V9XFW3_9ACAR|nr:la-related protein 1B-like [Tropilaelaps mercedesae]